MKQIDESPEISVVIPCLDEEESLNSVYSKTIKVLENIRVSFEIIFVDDGSTDKTIEVGKTLIESDKRIRLVKHARNYGHMNALHTGLSLTKGDFVVTMDADLQDPPEAIFDFYRILKSQPSVSVVQSYRKDRRSDTFYKRFTANIYYRVIKSLTGVNIVNGAADFRMMKRELVKEIVDGGKPIVLRLFIPASGHNIEYFPITRSKRVAGKTKYSTMKMLWLAYDSLIDFSEKPLKFMSRLSLFMTLALAFGVPLSVFLWKYTETVSGWTSIVLLILLYNSTILALLSLLGEYLSRLYSDKGRSTKMKWQEISQ